MIWLLWLCVGLGLVLTAAVACLLWVGMRDDLRPVDVAVVLGNHVHGDGTCTPRLAARLDRAIDLYRDGFFPAIIVSGGTSSSDADEAAAMAGYLATAGVPSAAIVEDRDGVNTAATAANTAAWMRTNGAGSVMAVSQYFHIARILFAFRQNGIKGTAHASASWHGWRDFYSVPRELVALVWYALGRGRPRAERTVSIRAS